ncbi:MAG: glycyl-radical enzyme activating protein [Atribacterota bacterium]|nr:glycyl-radical enzyme activating protein [Atribacterota bacterium]
MIFLTDGIIFNINKFAIHDGPGIRSTVFLKGCPLRCQWCHNPEGWLTQPEIIFDEQKCIKCYQCLSYCPQQAITLKNDYPYTDKQKCQLCGNCVTICLGKAREIIGYKVSSKEVMTEIKKDLIFYEESDGGVTFSGGEPLLQIDFLSELLYLCQQEGISRAVDTCGYAPWSHLERIIPLVDLWLYDLKVMNEQRHLEYTGVSNQLILENLKRLSQKSNNIELRIPLIPGVNDDKEEVEEMAKLINSLNIGKVSVLPFHRMGLDKYTRLGLKTEMKATTEPSAEYLEKIAQLFNRFKIPITIGG